MNRNTVARVLADMRNGRRVLVLSDTQHTARHAFAEVAAHAADGEKIRRTAGAERIIAANGPGWIAFGSSRGNRFRGITADVIVVDGHAPDSLDHILPAVMTSPVGEVIHS